MGFVHPRAPICRGGSLEILKNRGSLGTPGIVAAEGMGMNYPHFFGRFDPSTIPSPLEKEQFQWAWKHGMVWDGRDGKIPFQPCHGGDSRGAWRFLLEIWR